MPDIGQSFI